MAKSSRLPERMEIYQLRTFLAIAEEGHLTRAAERLFQSQPAVSNQLRALEEELGLRLFDRTARGMQLTVAGSDLLEPARRIVASTAAFKQHAEDLRDTVSGELVLGLNNSPATLRLLPVLRSLSEQHPDLSYELVSGSSGVIQKGLVDGAISIGFFEGDLAHPAISTHWLVETELALVAPRAWADELSTPDWTRLASKPWIFVSPECSYARVIETFARKNGLTIERKFTINEDLTMLNLVAEGLGVSLVARSHLKVFPRRDDLYVLPHFSASVPLQIGYPKARSHQASIQAVRDAILAVWQPTADRPSVKP